MKSLNILIALIFFGMFSSSSYAGWKTMDETVNGDILYVDFERIRKHDGYVYFWHLIDYLNPIASDLSAKVYNQGDCNLFRFKSLSYIFYDEPMGGGTGDTVNEPNKEWRNPRPNSVDEEVLQTVCANKK